MDSSDVIAMIQAGNTAALQWFVLTHPASTQAVGSVSLTTPGATINTGSQNTILLIGLLAVAAFLLTK